MTNKIPVSTAPLHLGVRLFVIAVLFACSSRLFANDSNNTASLRKACEFLWTQQGDDGGWHSEQYAVLRSGQALTPFVLHTLLQIPESVCPRPEGGAERALEFLRSHIDDNGALGHDDPEITEYPVYSTAYALQCLVAVKNEPKLSGPNDPQLTTRMYAFLSAAQFDESHGFATTHAAYGGWGFDVAQEDGDSGHMDLAHTRRALQALRALMPDRGYPQFTRGELFLRVVQRHPGALADPPRIMKYLHYRSHIPFDGGFYFSPIVDEANKGRFQAGIEGQSAPHFRSYATATCDGILALLACGVTRSDERVVRAVEWLRSHDDLTYPQGVPTDHPEPWGEAIRFYHYAVRAETYAALNWPGDWKTRLAAEIARHQAADGSFRNNASPLMKEDDPLLCTALATIALTHCQNGTSEELSPRAGGDDAPAR
jgi:squalene-hopene/tetraprenyl-beta-curcumene cyclase